MKSKKDLNIAQKAFKKIKISIFFQIFCDYKGWWVVPNRSGKFQIFFVFIDPSLREELKKIPYWGLDPPLNMKKSIFFLKLDHF